MSEAEVLQITAPGLDAVRAIRLFTGDDCILAVALGSRHSCPEVIEQSSSFNFSSVMKCERERSEKILRCAVGQSSAALSSVPSGGQQMGGNPEFGHTPGRYNYSQLG